MVRWRVVLVVVGVSVGLAGLASPAGASGPSAPAQPQPANAAWDAYRAALAANAAAWHHYASLEGTRKYQAYLLRRDYYTPLNLQTIAVQRMNNRLDRLQTLLIPNALDKIDRLNRRSVAAHNELSQANRTYAALCSTTPDVPACVQLKARIDALIIERDLVDGTLLPNAQTELQAHLVEVGSITASIPSAQALLASYQAAYNLQLATYQTFAAAAAVAYQAWLVTRATKDAAHPGGVPPPG